MVNGVCACPPDRELNLTTNLCDCLPTLTEVNTICELISQNQTNTTNQTS